MLSSMILEIDLIGNIHIGRCLIHDDALVIIKPSVHVWLMASPESSLLQAQKNININLI
jgi:hypothetical protein